MSNLPGASLRATVRIFIKAALLLLIVNFLCLATGFNPIDSLTQLNLFRLLGFGRVRLFYPGETKNGLLPIESLLATHEIAFKPKADDEYRIIMLGNSGPYGAGLSDDETLSAQLNQWHLLFGPKHVTVFNLGYPSATVINSTLILDSAAKYQPDLIILFVTGNSFDNSPVSNDQPLVLDRVHLERLAAQYRMNEWLTAHLSPKPSWYAWIGIRDQGTLLAWTSSLLNPWRPIELPKVAQWDLAAVVPATPNNFEAFPGISVMPNEVWQFLPIAQDIAQKAGAKLLVVNQPTIVLRNTPYSADSYSRLYGRKFYDHYRAALSTYCQAHDLWCLDLWDNVPQDEYTDSELHLSAKGWTIVADKLVSAWTTDTAQRVIIRDNGNKFN